MAVADRNSNWKLSFTELTIFLDQSPFEIFGRWIASLKSRGFRKYDADGEGIDISFYLDYPISKLLRFES